MFTIDDNGTLKPDMPTEAFAEIMLIDNMIEQLSKNGEPVNFARHSRRLLIHLLTERRKLNVTLGKKK